MRSTHWIAAGFALLAAVVPAHAQGKIVGDWHGVLQSPVGPMTLIIRIAEGEQGALGANWQAPIKGRPRFRSPASPRLMDGSRLPSSPRRSRTKATGLRPNSTGLVSSYRAQRCH